MASPEVIELSGSPEEIGYQHGDQLRERVGRTWQFYSSILFGDRTGELENLGNQYLDVIRGFSPGRAAEICGIAHGARMQDWQIAALNARTEIFHRFTGGQGVGECTAAYFKAHRILGQNWDWMEQLEPLIVVLDITREDGHRIVQMSEPGIIGKIGLNSAGLGVCLNILTGGESPVAVPVHVILREALECTSLEEFRSRLQTLDRIGTHSHILAADADGRYMSVELCGEGVDFVEYDGEDIFHTNHYLGRFAAARDNETDPLFEGSMTRYGRAVATMSEMETPGVHDMKALLSDRTDADAEICSGYRKKLGLMIGTVSSVVMDLPERKMHVTIGNPVDNSYHQLKAANRAQ